MTECTAPVHCPMRLRTCSEQDPCFIHLCPQDSGSLSAARTHQQWDGLEQTGRGSTNPSGKLVRTTGPSWTLRTRTFLGMSLPAAVVSGSLRRGLQFLSEGLPSGFQTCCVLTSSCLQPSSHLRAVQEPLGLGMGQGWEGLDPAPGSGIYSLCSWYPPLTGALG